MKILNWTRITELFVECTVHPTDADGNTVIITGVQAALLPYLAKSPTSSTVWKSAIYDSTAHTAKVLIYGPDAADPGQTYAFALPVGGGDLWIRVVDSPEVVPEMLARIELVTD